MIQVSRRDVASVSLMQLYPGCVADGADPAQTLVSSSGGDSAPTAPRVTLSGLHLNYHLPFDLPSVHSLDDKGSKQKFSGTNQKMSPL